MANLSQTAANVTIGSLGARSEPATGGEAITQGMPCYLSPTDGNWFQSDANIVAASTATHGIATTPCSGAGQPFNVMRLTGQDVNLGATLVRGETYVVSATKGAICPISDLVANDYVIYLGYARTTSLLRTMFAPTGVQKA